MFEINFHSIHWGEWSKVIVLVCWSYKNTDSRWKFDSFRRFRGCRDSLNTERKSDKLSLTGKLIRSSKILDSFSDGMSNSKIYLFKSNLKKFSPPANDNFWVVSCFTFTKHFEKLKRIPKISFWCNLVSVEIYRHFNNFASPIAVLK